jgi:hypothetical protein
VRLQTGKGLQIGPKFHWIEPNMEAVDADVLSGETFLLLTACLTAF